MCGCGSGGGVGCLLINCILSIYIRNHKTFHIRYFIYNIYSYRTENAVYLYFASLLYLFDFYSRSTSYIKHKDAPLNSIYL